MLIAAVGCQMVMHMVMVPVAAADQMHMVVAAADLHIVVAVAVSRGMLGSPS